MSAQNRPGASGQVTQRRLHVNVDHVATLRQARRGAAPDPLDFARACIAAGAHGITIHLRKDRRHIQDQDVLRMRRQLTCFLNLEVSLDEEMLAIAEHSGAEGFCLVPENRQEITTEGGLDVVSERARLKLALPRLQAAGGLISLFVDPDPVQIRAAAELGAPFIELHTGSYAHAFGDPIRRARELERLAAAAELGRELGLRINAGHGLNRINVGQVAALPGIEELNIGHALVGDALFSGVHATVRDYLDAIGSESGSQPEQLPAADRAGTLDPEALPLQWIGMHALLQAPPATALPPWATAAFTISRSEHELSLVIDQRQLPEVLPAGWRLVKDRLGFRIAARIPMEAVGVLARLSALLAASGVSLFAVSTFDTDYLFIPADQRELATASLRAAGYRFIEPA